MGGSHNDYTVASLDQHVVGLSPLVDPAEITLGSTAVNTLFYGGAFALCRIGVFVPSLTKIAVMFGVGIGLDSVITFAMLARFVRRAGAATSSRVPPLPLT